MFDHIIPIGNSCNITFLLENAKLKKHTTLFEWFVSPNLIDIIDILTQIENTDSTDQITTKNGHVYIGNSIYSGHYTIEEFKTIYQRRRQRLLDIMKNSKRLLLCRFESTSIVTNELIDQLIKTLFIINKDLVEVKLLFITPQLGLSHPSLITIFYDKHSEDPYCKGKEINDLFVNTLIKIGYDVNHRVESSFTDKSLD